MKLRVLCKSKIMVDDRHVFVRSLVDDEAPAEVR
jgi:hypothetical protein